MQIPAAPIAFKRLWQHLSQAQHLALTQECTAAACMKIAAALLRGLYIDAQLG